ncbi:hypothetical protein QOT17_001373 [Balamuthia mandrillaris]
MSAVALHHFGQRYCPHGPPYAYPLLLLFLLSMSTTHTTFVAATNLHRNVAEARLEQPASPSKPEPLCRVARLSRETVGTGFHRDLRTNFTLLCSALSSKNSSSLSLWLLLEEKFSADLFVDLFQVREMERLFSGPSVEVLRQYDLEKAVSHPAATSNLVLVRSPPLSLSPGEGSVLRLESGESENFRAELNTVMESSEDMYQLNCSIALPIHLRYQLPQLSSPSFPTSAHPQEEDGYHSFLIFPPLRLFYFFVPQNEEHNTHLHPNLSSIFANVANGEEEKSGDISDDEVRFVEKRLADDGWKEAWRCVSTLEEEKEEENGSKQNEKGDKGLRVTVRVPVGRKEERPFVEGVTLLVTTLAASCLFVLMWWHR